MISFRKTGIKLFLRQDKERDQTEVTVGSNTAKCDNRIVSPYFNSNQYNKDSLLDTPQNFRLKKKMRSKISKSNDFLLSQNSSSKSISSESSNSDHELSKSLPSISPLLGNLVTEIPQPKCDFTFSVHVRIRPMSDTSDTSPAQRVRCVTAQNDTDLTLSTRPNTKLEHQRTTLHKFSFERVYDEGANQREVYDGCASEVMQYATEGYNACLIAYGISGSGKSHTLYGKTCSKNKGLITRGVESILKTFNDGPLTEHKLTASFLQIYNEKFYDLIDPSLSEKIHIQENNGVAEVEGMAEIDICTTGDVAKILRKNPNRLRDSAGRSHTVFILRYSKDEKPSPKNEAGGAKEIKLIRSKIYFVDLVGINRSVRHISHESPAVSMAETKNAKSLQLFNQLLCKNNTKIESETPKDSKLIRILRNTIGGNWVTRLLVTVMPCPTLSHETLGCLQVAETAMSIRNHPSANVRFEKPSGPKSKRKKSLSLPEVGTSPMMELPNKLPPICASNSLTNKTSEKSDSSLDLSSLFDDNSVDHEDNVSSESSQNKSRTPLPYLQLQSPKPYQSYPNKNCKEPANNYTEEQSNSGDKIIHDHVSGNMWLHNIDKSNNNNGAKSTNVKNQHDNSKAISDHTVIEKVLLPKAQSKSSTMEDESSSNYTCCPKCNEHISKIKKDYDRMIIFSKKDRDEKQARLSELEKCLKELQNEALISHQIKYAMAEEAVVNATKDKTEEIIDLKAKLKQETDLHTRTRINMDRMKKDYTLRLTEANRKWEEKLTTSTGNHKRDVAKLEKAIKDLTTRYGALSQERDKYKKAENELKHKFTSEKESLQAEISTLQKDLNDLKTNIEEMKTNSVEKKTSSPPPAVVETKEAPTEEQENADLNRDEELRLLLLQDAKNREVLIQLKRDRNLLRDVMKIMYSRGWFAKEAKPHIERTLCRVGIDTRTIVPLKKR